MQYPFLVFVLLSSLFFIPLHFSKQFKKIVTSNYFSIIVIGLIVHLLMANPMFSSEPDVTHLKSWSERLVAGGFANFYDPKAPAYTTYPPAYLYMLYIIGLIKEIFGIAFSSELYTVMIKLPAIICDLLMGVLIYKVAYKRVSPIFAWWLGLAFVVCPAILVDSVIWGQVESIYTFFMLLSLFYMMDKKYLAGFMFYAVAILSKPQALIIAPIYLYIIYDILASNDFKWKGIKEVLICGFSSLSLMILLTWPFARTSGFWTVIQQYKNTLGLSRWSSGNGYNFYSLIGSNVREIHETYFLISYLTMGRIAIVVITILSLIVLHRTRKKPNYYMVAAFLNSMAFMFVTQMHERYIFPSVAFLFMVLIYRFNRKTLLLAIGYSVVMFVNTFDILFDSRFHLMTISFFNLQITLLLLYVAFTWGRDEVPEIEVEENGVKTYKTGVSVKLSKHVIIGLAALFTIGYFYPHFLYLKKHLYVNNKEAIEYLETNGLDNGLTTLFYPNYITGLFEDKFDLSPVIARGGKAVPKTLGRQNSQFDEEFDFVLYSKKSKIRVSPVEMGKTFGYTSTFFDGGKYQIFAYPEGIDINNPTPVRLKKDVVVPFDLSVEFMLGDGWAGNEDGRRWSLGEKAFIDILVEDFNENIVLTLKYEQFYNNQEMGDVYVNGTKVVVENDLVGKTLKIHIPNEIYTDELHIELNLPNRISPIEIGQSMDSRKLGIYVQNLVIQSDI